jgi:hypothetical protein
MSDAPEYANWQEAWEAHARGELDGLRARPVPELLSLVRAGRFGGYFVLWDAIAERATLAEAGWPLFAALMSNADYLDRYHCADALLKLLGTRIWEPVLLTAGDGEARQVRLAQLRAELEHRVGPDNGGSGPGES